MVDAFAVEDAVTEMVTEEQVPALLIAVITDGKFVWRPEPVNRAPTTR